MATWLAGRLQPGDIDRPWGDVARLFLPVYEAASLTPLFLAAYQGDAEMVRLLLNQGASPAAQLRTLGGQVDGYTPLYCCVMWGRPNVVGVAEALIDGGAEAKTQPAGAVPPLLLAIERRSCELAQLLLRAGADVAAVDPRNGRTPLHAAAMEEMPIGLLKSLIDAGANVNAEDVLGLRPLDYAASSEVADLLTARGASRGRLAQGSEPGEKR